MAARIDGVDISHHQPGTIDYAAAKKAGVKFLYHKASESGSFRDDNYAVRRAQARKAGIPFGAYHFARPDRSGKRSGAEEARFFLSVAQPSPGDMLPVLDLEDHSGLSDTALTAWVGGFVGEVRKSLGVLPVIYTPFDLKKNFGCPLWVARYSDSMKAPNVPKPWKHWSIWQFSDGQFGVPDRVPGFGHVDINTLAGVPAQTLQSLRIPKAKKPVPKPRPTPKVKPGVRWTALRVIQSNVLFKKTSKQFLFVLNVILRLKPDLFGMNEVGSRRHEMAAWAQASKYGVHHPEGAGMRDDQALFWRIARFTARSHHMRQMHGEPPGKPTARFAIATILYDNVAKRHVILMAFHSLAAVERSNKLNNIERARYYVLGIANLIRFAIDLRRYCKRHFGEAGQVILVGDLNWHWSLHSWIQKRLGGYFESNHKALGVIHTLGRRGVDIVAKHGMFLRFKSQAVKVVPSDHRLLLVDMEEQVRT